MTSPVPPTVHVPVLMREVLRALDLRPGLVVVDGTLGGGGHAAQICTRIGADGLLIGLDRDPLAIERSRPHLQGPRLELVAASYLQLPEVLARLGLLSVDRIFVDLGLSSDQLADQERGFSFHSDGPLDLRFNPAEGIPAHRWLATATEQQMIDVFQEYGEDSAARKIAGALVSRRNQSPLTTARQFAGFLEDLLGKAGRDEKHPATRIFQALRIAVNQELEHVHKAITDIFPRCLAAGGILAVISFHSLEDRIVKQAFREGTVWENVSAKPIGPTPAEERVNPRSRSAKLRIARRGSLPLV